MINHCKQLLNSSIAVPMTTLTCLVQTRRLVFSHLILLVASQGIFIYWLNMLLIKSWDLAFVYNNINMANWMLNKFTSGVVSIFFFPSQGTCRSFSSWLLSEHWKYLLNTSQSIIIVNYKSNRTCKKCCLVVWDNFRNGQVTFHSHLPDEQGPSKSFEGQAWIWCSWALSKPFWNAIFWWAHLWFSFSSVHSCILDGEMVAVDKTTDVWL